MCEKDFVSALDSLLAERLGQNRFDLWFGPSTRRVFTDGTLVVESPNQFSQDWLRKNFRAEIEAACRLVSSQPVAIEFRVNESLGQAGGPGQPNAESAADPTATPCPSLKADHPDAADVRLHQPNGPAPAAASESRRSSAGESSGPRRRYATFGTFIVGASNRLAYASAHTAVERLGKFSPLLIHGP